MFSRIIVTFLAFFMLFSGYVYAAGSPYDAIVSAVSFTDVALGVVGIATAVAGFYVTFKGVKFLIHAIKGA